MCAVIWFGARTAAAAATALSIRPRRHLARRLIPEDRLGLRDELRAASSGDQVRLVERVVAAEILRAREILEERLGDRDLVPAPTLRAVVREHDLAADEIDVAPRGGAKRVDPGGGVGEHRDVQVVALARPGRPG
jgi:hypothetical protein